MSCCHRAVPSLALALLVMHLVGPVYCRQSSKRIGASPTYEETRAHKIRCYSCMSTFYEGAWIFLSRAFTRPLNFTSECDFPTAESRIGMVDCSSVCIKMWEDTTLLGMPFRGFIRGCYDSMLVQGFNQTIVRWYRWLHRDSCHFYNKQEVLQLPFRDRENRDRHDNSPNQMLHICTCYSHGCNGPSRGVSKERKLLFDQVGRYRL
uniref:Protein quiver n=1 Tax=Trichuris muris TaxID=70415 RepID=A0A5S6Q045_TRIMR